MITRAEIEQDIFDFKYGRMGYNALMDAIDTYVKQQAKNLQQSNVIKSLPDFDTIKNKLEYFFPDESFEDRTGKIPRGAFVEWLKSKSGNV